MSLQDILRQKADENRANAARSAGVDPDKIASLEQGTGQLQAIPPVLNPNDGSANDPPIGQVQPLGQPGDPTTGVSGFANMQSQQLEAAQTSQGIAARMQAQATGMQHSGNSIQGFTAPYGQTNQEHFFEASAESLADLPKGFFLAGSLKRFFDLSGNKVVPDSDGVYKPKTAHEAFELRRFAAMKDGKVYEGTKNVDQDDAE